MEIPSANPCLECGACCACYRVSFYWGETSDENAGVPGELTGQLTQHRVFMRGTNEPNVRCVALMGIIGKKVHCSIHQRRPSVCRDFQPSWQDGRPHPDCDIARARYDLNPLHPHHWPTDNDREFPRAA